jgi:hypothetical protein
MNVSYQSPTSKQHQSLGQREDIECGTEAYLPCPRIPRWQDGMGYRRRVMTLVGNIAIHPVKEEMSDREKRRANGLWRQRANFYTLSCPKSRDPWHVHLPNCLSVLLPNTSTGHCRAVHGSHQNSHVHAPKIERGRASRVTCLFFQEHWSRSLASSCDSVTHGPGMNQFAIGAARSVHRPDSVTAFTANS